MKEKTFSLFAQGTTFQELFKEVSAQLLVRLIDPEDVGEAIRERVVLEAPEAQALLRDWIQALLNLANHQRIIFLRIHFLDFRSDPAGAVQLKAEVVGELIDPVRHQFRLNPATLHATDVQMTQESDHITARITF